MYTIGMAPIQPASAVDVVFGTVIIGNAAKQSCVRDLSQAGKILVIFRLFGNNEADTSKYYGSRKLQDVGVPASHIA